MFYGSPSDRCCCSRCHPAPLCLCLSVHAHAANAAACACRNNVVLLQDIASWAYAAGITLPSPMAELAIKGADNHQQQAAAAGATAAGAAAGVAATKPGALPEASKPDAKTGAEAAAGAAQQGAAAVFMATEGAAGQKVANGRLPEEQDGEEAPPPGARSLADHAEWLQRKELEAHGALK